MSKSTSSSTSSTSTNNNNESARTPEPEATRTAAGAAATSILPGLDPAAWQQLAEQHLARLGTTVETMEKLQARGREQLVAAVDEVTREMNRLFKAQLDYVTAMQREWHQASIDMVRRNTNVAG